MTPAEHYAEAERLLATLKEVAHTPGGRAVLARAQVHATLATVDPEHIGRRRPPIVVVPGEDVP